MLINSLIPEDDLSAEHGFSVLSKGVAIYSSFSLATPLLHLIAATLLLPRYNRNNPIKAICMFPFNGGIRTFIFQLLTWLTWLASLSIALPLLLRSSSSSSAISLQYTTCLAGQETLFTIASVGAVFSLLFLLKSILVFEDEPPLSQQQQQRQQPSTTTPHHPVTTRRMTKQQSPSPSSSPPPQIRVVSRPSRLPSKSVASILIVAIGLLWAALGSALLFIAADYYASSDMHIDTRNIERDSNTANTTTTNNNNNNGNLGYYAVVYYALAAAAFATGVFTTHGLAGRLLWDETTSGSGRRKSLSPPSSPCVKEQQTTVAKKDMVQVCSSSARRRNSTGSRNNNNSSNKKKSQSCTSDEPAVENKTAMLERSLSSSSSELAEGGWRFFQPFQGGAFFIATQALGWAFFSLALIFVIFLSVQAGKGVALGLHWWSVTTTSLVFAAEISLATSLAVYKGQEAIRSRPITSKNFLIKIKRAAIMSLLFIPTHIFLAIFITSLAILPTWYVLPMWTGGLVIYYACSGTGVAEFDGTRSWPKFQEWLGRELDSLIPSWMGSFEINSEWTDDDHNTKGGKGRKYIFGYAPHALYPIWAGMLPLTNTWRRMFPGINPIPLSATVIFLPPLLRDVASWVGTRSVSRASFVRALNERGAVILVPGGQAELLEAYRMRGRYTKHRKSAVGDANGGKGTDAMNGNNTNIKPRVIRECVVVRRHKGFVRLAIQHQASLVPTLVLGELNSLWNLVEWPWLAKRSYKILGFPIPFLIVGKWNILPLPAKTGLRVVIGKPIHPPPVSSALLSSEDVEKQVDEMHRRYYESLAAMFERHSRDFPGYEDVKLVLE